MKLFCKIIKRVVVSIFSIYTIDILFSNLNIYIPFNFLTIIIGVFLGIYGLIGLILIQFFL
ncbi:MAG: pro-sigmaK processing inhibitor BofA family protein [Candidatus Coprovivens sp.]